MSDDPLDLDTGLPARIAADAAVLAPAALSVARRLPASADADGIIRADHRALAREFGTDVATIVGALDQLVRRGHLIKAPGKRTEPKSRRPSQSPRVVPFPKQHNRGFVERQATRMARLSREGAATYLRRILQAHAGDMRARGIAEELIEREIDTLSAAIRAASFTAVLIPDDREPA